MRDPCRTYVARSHTGCGYRSRAAWELVGFIAGLLLALLSAPFFWI
jgi:hypothetical protein